MQIFRVLYVVFSLFLLFSGENAFCRQPDRIEFHVISIQIEPSICATLLTPADLKSNEKVPVLLVFGGFENAARVLNLVHTNRRVALAGFDYPYSGPRDLPFPKSLRFLPQMKRIFPLTLEGIHKFVEILRKRPEIDPKNIAVIGASFGSPFAIAAGAQEPGISKVVIVHGFGSIPDTIENVILRAWRNVLPRYPIICKAAAWSLSRLGWKYLDIKSPEEYARQFDRSKHVLMITAEKDSFIPKKSSESLWAAIQKSNAQSSLIEMPTDHLMPGSDHLISEIVMKVEDWMLRNATT